MLIVDPVDGGVASVVRLLQDRIDILHLEGVVVLGKHSVVICNNVTSGPVGMDHIGVSLSGETVLSGLYVGR